MVIDLFYSSFSSALLHPVHVSPPLCNSKDRADLKRSSLWPTPFPFEGRLKYLWPLRLPIKSLQYWLNNRDTGCQSRDSTLSKMEPHKTVKQLPLLQIIIIIGNNWRGEHLDAALCFIGTQRSPTPAPQGVVVDPLKTIWPPFTVRCPALVNLLPMRVLPPSNCATMRGIVCFWRTSRDQPPNNTQGECVPCPQDTTGVTMGLLPNGQGGGGTRGVHDKRIMEEEEIRLQCQNDPRPIHSEASHSNYYPLWATAREWMEREGGSEIDDDGRGGWLGGEDTW